MTQQLVLVLLYTGPEKQNFIPLYVFYMDISGMTINKLHKPPTESQHCLTMFKYPKQAYHKSNSFQTYCMNNKRFKLHVCVTGTV